MMSYRILYNMIQCDLITITENTDSALQEVELCATQVPLGRVRQVLAGRQANCLWPSTHMVV